MMDEAVLSSSFESADSRFRHCLAFDRAGAELGVIGEDQCGRPSRPTHCRSHRGFSVGRLWKLAMALSAVLSGTVIQATQCTMAAELDAHERLDPHAAPDSIGSASRDEMCRAYMDQFVNVVAARVMASSRENDAERQHSLDRLDAKIAATNERLAEKCGD
jgi:hypothetical protein